MQRQRRNFLQACLALGGLCLANSLALANSIFSRTERNKPAFISVQEPDALAKLFPGQTITKSDQIEMGVHSLVENGAVVPIKISSTLKNVESISIFVEKNPNPLIAHFNLNPRCQPFIATRIKIQTPSNVSAVVVSNGKPFSATKFVEVTEGGCA